MTDRHASARPTGIRSKNPSQSWYIMINGHRLRQLRRDRGLTQTDLAGKVRISVTTLGRLERLPWASCRTRTFARLAVALGEDPRSTTWARPAD